MVDGACVVGAWVSGVVVRGVRYISIFLGFNSHAAMPTFEQIFFSYMSHVTYTDDDKTRSRSRQDQS
jgi:hypothetical protein